MTIENSALTWGEGMPLRGDRIHAYVNAFCPQCHDENPSAAVAQRLSGWLAERNGRIWLERGCPKHGFIRTMYEENPEILSYLETWTSPTKWHIPDTPGNFDPIPAAYLKGLGEMQTQHTCILLEDIIEECNLKCPTCFTESSPELRGVTSAADIIANVDQRLARENGRLDVVMLSGGEPTLHPELREIVTALLERNIVRILINSNGLKIAKDDELVSFLEQHRDRVEIYLQFDGLSAESSKHHRGGDLTAQKRTALERLSKAKVFTTLTMTATLGVNDNEIGDVIMTALSTPFVGGVSIQPVFGSGRSHAIDASDRLTNTGVLARLESQTNSVVTWRDLTSLPCSHPHCASVGYMIRQDAGDWKSLTALMGEDTMRRHLGLVSNRVVDQELPSGLRKAIQASLLGLLSEQSSLSHPAIGDLWKDICEACDIGMASLMKLAASAGLKPQKEALRNMLGERVVRITVKPFMDINTMIEDRLIQCCVHVGTKSADQHQCAPFCAVQAWRDLSDQRVSHAMKKVGINVR